MIKGLTFVRKVDNHAVLMSVVESQEISQLKSEHQYLTLGSINNPWTFLGIHNNYEPKDLTETVKGYAIGDLLKLPIWQT